MTEITPAASELLRQLLLILSVGLPGLPPGEMDPQLTAVIPADAVLALQWSGRGEGVPGAPGLSGALADPEILRAAEALRVLSEFYGDLSRELGEEAGTAADRHAAEMAHALFTYPGCLFVSVGPPAAGGGKGLASLLRAGLVINPGKETDDVLARLQTRLPHWLLVDATSEAAAHVHTTGLVKFRRLGDRLAWSFGDALPGIEQRLSQQQQGLDEVPEFRELLPHARVESVGGSLWIRLPGATAQLVTAMAGLPVDAFEAVQNSLRQVGSLHVLSMWGLEEGHVVARTAIRCSALASSDQGPLRPIPLASLQRVPADVHVLAALGCDVGPLLTGLLSAAESMLPSGSSNRGSLRVRLEEQLGLDLFQDLSSPFGSTWLISSAPSTGGALGLSPVFSLDVRDPRSAYAAFTQLMTAIQQLMPDETPASVRLKTEMFLDRMLYTLQYRDRNAWGLAPCFCLTDRELLVTLQPQTMRAHLRFLEEGGATFASQIENRRESFPDNLVAGLFVDAPRFTEVIWPLAPLAANAPLNRLQEFGLGIDGSDWPSVAAILRYSRPMTATIRRTAFGVACEVKNPLSLAAPVLAGVAIPAFQRAELPYADRPSDPEPSIEVDLGAPAGAAPDAETTTPAPEAELPAESASASDEPRAGQTFRAWAPSLIRAFTPDDVEMLIPDEVFRRIEEGPDAETLRRREERRAARQKKRSLMP